MTRLTHPPEDVQKAGKVLRSALGLTDILVNYPKRRLYLLAAPRTLEHLLDPEEGRGPGRARAVTVQIEARVNKRADDWCWRSTDCWDDLEVAVVESLCWLAPSQRDAYDKWTVLPVPLPGSPQVPTWSATKGKLLPAKRPPVFRLCDEPRVTLGSGATGPLLLRTHWGDEGPTSPDLFLSHTVDLSSLDQVARCNGLLWPSFALGWKLTPGYGEVLFLASVDAVWGGGPRGMEAKVTMHRCSER